MVYDPAGIVALALAPAVPVVRMVVESYATVTDPFDSAGIENFRVVGCDSVKFWLQQAVKLSALTPASGEPMPQSKLTQLVVVDTGAPEHPEPL